MREADHVHVLPSVSAPRQGTIALSAPHRDSKARADPEARVWTTLDALAGGPCYQMAAAAISCAVTFVNPAAPRAGALATGVGAEANLVPTVEGDAARASFADRLQKGATATTSLKAALAAAAANEGIDEHLRDCMSRWAEGRPSPRPTCPRYRPKCGPSRGRTRG